MQVVDSPRMWAINKLHVHWCRCRLELTEEMLKIKQRPAVTVNPLAGIDIEKGLTERTDAATHGLNPTSDHASEMLDVPAAHTQGSLDRSPDCYKAPTEQRQQHSASRPAVFRDATNQQPP